MDMSAMTAPLPSHWITDSGASHHVTYDTASLNFDIPYNGTKQLFVEDGKGLFISNIGHALIRTSNATFRLNDVLLVPQASHNLLSVYKLVHDNWSSLTFDPFRFYIKDLRTRMMLFQGPNEGGLYPFYLNASNGVSGIVVSPHALMVAKADIHSRHIRLGHPSSGILHSVLNKSHLPVIGSINKLFVCPACQMGKASRLPFYTLPCTSTRPFHLIHANVWGSSPTSSCTGYIYYLILVDDFTKYFWLYPLSLKSDVCSALKHFIFKVQTLFEFKIQCLRSDSGGEFLSHALQNFLNEKGITHQLSCPHTLEHNGCAERKQKHVVEMGRTLLSQRGVPPKFWVEVFQTTVYLFNRLSSHAS